MSQTVQAPSRSDPAEWDDLKTVVVADVRREASEQERAALREPHNLLRWSRALAVLEIEVNAGTAASRARVEAAKPDRLTATPEQTQQWLHDRHQERIRQASQTRFRQAVNARRIEARDALAQAGLDDRVTVESLVQTMTRALELFDDGDDSEAAAALLETALMNVEDALKVAS